VKRPGSEEPGRFEDEKRMLITKFWRGLLFDREPAGGGGGAAAAEKPDMGAPYDPDGDPPKPEAAKPALTAEQKELADARKELADAKAQLKEAQVSERYWAQRAKNGNAPEPEPDEDEPEDPERQAAGSRRQAAADTDEKPEQLLDDLSVSGLKALLKRGVITQAQFEEQLEGLEERINKRVDARLQQQDSWRAIDTELGTNYPDVWQDSKRVARGEKPQTEMYRRSAINLQQMVADDPKLKNSPAALLAAVRMAKKELDLEKKAEAKPVSQNRRERIESQMGERGGSGAGEDELDDDQLSPTAREIVNNLSKHLTVKGADGKVSITAEENYRRHAKNGR
jgi:hypothetical protein